MVQNILIYYATCNSSIAHLTHKYTGKYIVPNRQTRSKYKAQQLVTIKTMTFSIRFKYPFSQPNQTVYLNIWSSLDSHIWSGCLGFATNVCFGQKRKT